MNTENLGKMIAMLRKKKRLTQNQLASYLNISDKAVSKWENGGGYPDITQLPLLSKLFGVSIDYLLKGKTRGIAIAGTTLVVIVNMIDKYPQKNMLVKIKDVSLAVGGCVPNTIINLAKIDPDLFLSAYGKIGNDSEGRYVLEQLEKHGVNTSGMKVCTEKLTSKTNVMTEISTGARTFFYLAGAGGEFSAEDVDIDALDCEIFHIGYILMLPKLDAEDEKYGTKMAKFLHDLQKKGIKTSIDVVSEEGGRFAKTVIPALKYCNYVILNEIECCEVAGLDARTKDGALIIDNIRKAMETFMEYGVSDKVIVHCPEAGFALNDKKEFTVVPSLELPEGFIKGSVGAGDTFAAASLYGIYSSFTDEEILAFASCAAALNLTATDAVSGMKSRAEIEEMNRTFKRRDLQ
ncbi:MAG: helix-turn-helix domain-containing protein [Clostridia bacterium]|nr:helix-turn-helix domain-containing protein [Clostridia bacterium]